MAHRGPSGYNQGMMQTASVAQRPQEATSSPLPTRRLGKTELRVPLVGYGTAPGGSGLSDRDAIELLHDAIDRGVTYLDTAPAYERAQRQLRSVLAERRDEVIVATKVPVDGAAEALASLSESLEVLGTDHVDIAYVHSLGGRDVDRVLADDGALAGLRQAQRAGTTRFVGFTSHNRPQMAARVLRECEVDVIMIALNYGDQHTYGFERLVLPEARRRDVGVAAMKVYGGATGMRYATPTPAALTTLGPVDHERALRWALDQEGVAIAVIGMFGLAEVEQNVRWARRTRPLTAVELQALEHEGRSLAAHWGEHFGPP